MTNISDLTNNWTDIGSICLNIPTPFKRGNKFKWNKENTNISIVNGIYRGHENRTRVYLMQE